MSYPANRRLAAALVLCFLPMITPADDQGNPLPTGGVAKKLSSVKYYEPPNDQQVEVRFSGDEVTPLPDALYHVKKLTIEKYSADGKLEFVARAPECVYAQFDGLASSPGHLQIELGSGKVFVDCDGFQWNEKYETLVLSNNVHTIIKNGPGNPLAK
jgi:hypothetical protein